MAYALRLFLPVICLKISNGKKLQHWQNIPVYYSTGKILAVEVTKNGKTIPDERLEKINQVMKKGNESSKQEDYKTAIKNYSKAIELDSMYA